MTKQQTADTADQMIGAAQQLEAAARRLKEDARHVRAGHLHESMDAMLWRDHKAADVKRAAEEALRELGLDQCERLKAIEAAVVEKVAELRKN